MLFVLTGLFYCLLTWLYAAATVFDIGELWVYRQLNVYSNWSFPTFTVDLLFFLAMVLLFNLLLLCPHSLSSHSFSYISLQKTLCTGNVGSKLETTVEMKGQDEDNEGIEVKEKWRPVK